MKTEIKIENTANPYCVIHTQVESEAITRLANKIRETDNKGNESLLSCWDGDYCVQKKPSEIVQVYSQDKKVFVKTNDNDTFVLKIRLYQFEEKGWSSFVRVSNTDIVNIEFIEKFDLTFTGVIKIILKDKSVVQVSRRYMPKIKDSINNLRRSK